MVRRKKCCLLVVGLSPEFVVIAGEITRGWSLLIPGIQARMRTGLHRLTFERTHIVPASLKEKPRLVGAISLAIAERFGLPAHHV